MPDKREALMVVPCESHAGEVLSILGEEKVGDWLIVAALHQAVQADEVCRQCPAFVWPVGRFSLGRAAFYPVCGMSADPEHSLSLEHDGVTYQFCSAECRDRFAEDPEAWLSQQ